MKHAFRATGAGAAASSPGARQPGMAMAAPATLLTFPPMIDGELTRFVLDQHRVAYRETPHIFGIASLLAKLRAGTVYVPVLSDMGPVIAGARPIIDWCETRCPPGKKLVPADPALAAEVEAVWRRANNDLAAASAAYAYFHLLPHRDIMIVPLSRGAPGWEVLATKLAYPLFAGLIRKLLKLDEAKAAESLKVIRAVFAETEAKLADGRRWLVGGRLTLADIALATAAAPLLLPTGYGAPIPPLEAMPPVLQGLIRELRGTRTAEFVQAVYRQRPAKA
jgi:glutathione S-transferase